MFSLNLMVMGTPESCDTAADTLDRIHNSTVQASGTATKIFDFLDENWEGGAAALYHRAMENYTSGLDEIADSCPEWSRGLREFASSIRAVKQQMDEIQAFAKQSELRTEGPYIFAPAGPPPMPQPEIGTPGFKNKGVERYNTAADAYNQKVRAYNQCQQRVKEQRNKEDNAHEQLRSAFKIEPDKMTSVQKWVSGGSSFKGLIGTLDSHRRTAVAAAEHVRTEASAFQKYAMGDPMDLTKEQQKELTAFFKKSKAADMNVKAGRQLEKLLKFIPVKARDAITYYPLRPLSEDTTGQVKGLPKLAAGASKAFPWASGTIAAFVEGRGAVKGEISWKHAAANWGGSVGGGWVGGRVGSAVLGGITGGPYGALAGAIAGSTAGSRVGSDIVKGWYIGKQEAAIDKAYAPIPEARR